jgi:hypothetical protein
MKGAYIHRVNGKVIYAGFSLAVSTGDYLKTTLLYWLIMLYDARNNICPYTRKIIFNKYLETSEIIQNICENF